MCDVSGPGPGRFRIAIIDSRPRIRYRTRCIVPIGKNLVDLTLGFSKNHMKDLSHTKQGSGELVELVELDELETSVVLNTPDGLNCARTFGESNRADTRMRTVKCTMTSSLRVTSIAKISL